MLAHHVTEAFHPPHLHGRVSGLLGDERTEIRAPEAVVPLFVTSSPAVVADDLLMGVARAAG